MSNNILITEPRLRLCCSKAQDVPKGGQRGAKQRLFVSQHQDGLLAAAPEAAGDNHHSGRARRELLHHISQ